MAILIVEDEPKIARILEGGLTDESYKVDHAADGSETLKLTTSQAYELIILDLMIPKIDGITLCRHLRQRGLTTPILMLTAKDSIEDRVAGLDAGADDYVTKPFSLEEVLARTRALLRRPKQSTSVVLSVADLTLNPATKVVTRGGQKLELTPREYALLEYLMRHPNTILSQTQILEHVWDYQYEGLSNIVETYVKYLRKKLKTNPAAPEIIQTIRGLGYKVQG